MAGIEFEKDLLFAKMGYQPHPKQRLFHDSNARFRVAICGVRWGKSLAAAAEVIAELVKPNKRIWIVGPTYDLGEKEFRYVWEWYFKKLKLPAVEANYKVKQGKMLIRTPLNSSVEVRSAQHPKSLEGESLDGVVMSEAAKHYRSTWEFHLRARLTDRKGWALFPTTPDGYNWMYDLWTFGKTLEDWDSWQFATSTNPYIDVKEIENARQVLSEYAYRQQFLAEFTAMAGRVYSDFDHEIHIGSKLFNRHLPTWRVIDFGYTNPFCCLDIQRDSSDHLYITREYYERGKIIADHAAAMKRSAIQYEAYGADAEDPEAIESLRRKGIKATPLKFGVEVGCDLVRSFLKVRPDKRPGLFVDSSCVETIREFNMYRYPENRSRQVDTEKPLDKDNHAMDCIRMFCQWQMEVIPYSKSSETQLATSRVNLGELEL